MRVIDTAFDMQSDSRGKDPDSHSPTLRRYHQLLWSKPLPNGEMFELSTRTPGAYLHHRSDLGEFSLSSDSVMQTFLRNPRMRPISMELSEVEQESFWHTCYTIGGMLIFPANRVAGAMTINQARGLHPRIADRFDLTLECIRRYYRHEASPLGLVLARYEDFFALFRDFVGYVDFFLLNDLVSQDYGEVRFLLPFDDYRSPALPTDFDSYVEYRRRSIDFVVTRNWRIDQWSRRSASVARC